MRALADADLVLCSGGVSGRSPRSREAGAARPRGPRALLAHRTAAGQARMGGRDRRALVIALPGNPLSVLAGFELLVRPVLRRLAGVQGPVHATSTASAVRGRAPAARSHACGPVAARVVVGPASRGRALTSARTCRACRCARARAGRRRGCLRRRARRRAVARVAAAHDRDELRGRREQDREREHHAERKRADGEQADDPQRCQCCRALPARRAPPRAARGPPSRARRRRGARRRRSARAPEAPATGAAPAAREERVGVPEQREPSGDERAEQRGQVPGHTGSGGSRTSTGKVAAGRAARRRSPQRPRSRDPERYAGGSGAGERRRVQLGNRADETGDAQHGKCGERRREPSAEVSHRRAERDASPRSACDQVEQWEHRGHDQREQQQLQRPAPDHAIGRQQVRGRGLSKAGPASYASTSDCTALPTLPMRPGRRPDS